MLICCCTTSIIHTHLLNTVPSWFELYTVNTVFSILALVLAYALCVTCSYSYGSLPSIIAPWDECSGEHSLPGTKVPGNFRSWERKFPVGILGSEKSLNPHAYALSGCGTIYLTLYKVCNHYDGIPAVNHERWIFSHLTPKLCKNGWLNFQPL